MYVGYLVCLLHQHLLALSNVLVVERDVVAWVDLAEDVLDHLQQLALTPP